MSGSGRPVLVGVDGSASSVSAVAWAAVEARRRGLPLSIACIISTRPLGPSLLADAIVADARDLARAVAPGVTVRTAVHVGDAVAQLRRLARDATLLVVGRHGQHHRDGRPPGTTSSALAETVTVPMAVIGLDERLMPLERCTGPVLPPPTVARCGPAGDIMTSDVVLPAGADR